MQSIQSLRNDHAELAHLVAELERTIDAPTPPPAADLFALRQEFSKKLLAHLMEEDWLLYPSLLRHEDPAIAGVAQAFVDEMGGLLDAYRKWSTDWPAVAVAAHWPHFRAETRALCAALKRRIGRENTELYPLFEGLAKAA